MRVPGMEILEVRLLGLPGTGILEARQLRLPRRVHRSQHRHH